jgi:hypothetical protein
MTQPLRSTPTAPSRGFTATTSRSASAPRIGTQSLAGSTRLGRSLSPPPAGSTGTRLLTFHARAADQDHVAYVPNATRPITGHPPGSSRSTPHTPRFRRHFDFDNDTSPAISTIETAHRLPDPHLTHHLRLSVSLTTTVFSQRSTRWFGASPRRATPKGQTFISRTAPHQRTSPTSQAPLCVRDTGLSGILCVARRDLHGFGSWAGEDHA